MDSNALNEAITQICDRDDLGFTAFGGKSIPYIGWFWRRVNFDSDHYQFGVIPSGSDDDDCGHGGCNRVGFMENNKWGYPTVYCGPEQWARIKALLEVAVADPTPANLRAVNEAIQALAADKRYYSTTQWFEA